MKRQIFQHLYGIGNQFIKPQGRLHWWPINDDNWAAPASAAEPFSFHAEEPYLFGSAGEELSVRMKIAAGNADERLQQALREQALRDLARDLKASLNEDQLAEAIEHFMHYEKLFK